MDVPRISPKELSALVSRGETITIIDARRPESYDRSDARIPGALRIPPERIADAQNIPQGVAIVVYCDCPREVTSVNVAENLMQRNHTNVFALRGGLNAWRDAGLPEHSPEQWKDGYEAHAPTP